MASKSLLLLGLSFAIVLLIASEVSAKDLAEAPTTSNTVFIDKSKGAVEDKKAVKDAKYDRGYEGGEYGGYPGGGYEGGRGIYEGGRGGYEGGRGGYYEGDRGCYYGYCGYRCCNAAEAQAKLQN